MRRDSRATQRRRRVDLVAAGCRYIGRFAVGRTPSWLDYGLSRRAYPLSPPFHIPPIFALKTEEGSPDARAADGKQRGGHGPPRGDHVNGIVPAKEPAHVKELVGCSTSWVGGGIEEAID